MKRRPSTSSPLVFILIASAALIGAIAVGCHSTQNTPAQIDEGREIDFSEKSRGLEPPSNLSPSLQRLVDSSEKSRDVNGGPGEAPPAEEVGSPVPGTTDLYQVAIHITPEANAKAIEAAGAHIQTRLGNVLYATVHVHDLARVSEVDGVVRISPMPGGEIPRPPKIRLQTGNARGLDPGNGDAAKFDHQGLTGKGVIVGIIDTGIDWRHQDFMKPDGTTRILYLWDIFDDSWQKSNHTLGTQPPMNWDDGKPMGTLYTREQINLAIKGQLKIPRTDLVGHGTACAGTAAGNGLGVAPEADLVIADTYRDDPDHPNNDGSGGVQAAVWITRVAAERHEPCVMNLSFGGHGSPHDGTGEEEEGFNHVVNAGEAPGVVICASAGNEGQESMHARGRFGPGRPNELNGGFGSPVELFVRNQTVVGALFDSRDDWKLRIIGLDKFLFGDNQKPGRLDLFKSGQKESDKDGLKITGSDHLTPADQATIKALRHDSRIGLETLPRGTDEVVVTLPPGSYLVFAAGNSGQVTRGVFDLYLPDMSNASFGSGGDHKMVVGSPGDADHVITVGSYDFRNQWENASGSITHTGAVDLGSISAYSSAGFRRDGVVKPDIAGPGQFTISALADGCKMGKEGGPATITRDGKHLAWAGTSASTPYTVGVVALMLQKNPQLTSNQVKQILRDSADHDLEVTGAVPNGEWGYGKLNPSKAIEKVPAAPPAPAATTEPATLPTSQPSPTTEPVSAVTPSSDSHFAGVYRGDGYLLALVAQADGRFVGTMVKKDQTFTLDARVVASRLEGTVHNQGKDFSFNATLDGDKLTLHAGEKTFSLLREDAPRGMGDWLNRSVLADASEEGAARDLGAGLTFKPVAITDPMISNWTAYTLLLPEGWSFKGAIHWTQDPYAMVSPTIIAHAPGGFPGVLLYPQSSYIAGIREQRMQMFAGVGGADFMADAYAEGKLYQGKEIRTFAKSGDYIRRFVIPLYRKELAQAHVAGSEDAPKYAKMIREELGVGDSPDISVEAIRVRFQYDFKGRAIDEDMYCAITAFQMPGNLVVWWANTVSFAFQHGTMKESMPVLATIIASARPQLKWVNACIQVSQMMQQNIADAIAQEGMLSRYIARVNDEISDIIKSGYEERMKVQEQAAKDFDEYIRGVATYQGPNGPIQLPNTGNPWYMGPDGGYHQVAPGVPPDPSWQPMKPVQG